MPMGLPVHYRRSPKFNHTVARSSHGVAATRFIDSLIENVIEGTVKGVGGFLPCGSPVTIFTTCTGSSRFLTSLPMAKERIHIARGAGCDLCSFRRDQRSNPSDTAYVFVTDLHFANSSVKRPATRQRVIFHSNPPPRDINYSGIHDYPFEAASPYALVNLEMHLATAFDTTD